MTSLTRMRPAETIARPATEGPRTNPIRTDCSLQALSKGDDQNVATLLSGVTINRIG